MEFIVRAQNKRERDWCSESAADCREQTARELVGQISRSDAALNLLTELICCAGVELIIINFLIDIKSCLSGGAVCNVTVIGCIE